MTEHLEPGDVIAPDAIRLPAGPVPLRWGTTGPVIGWVTLEREDDGYHRPPTRRPSRTV